jgi:hypothetical protein
MFEESLANKKASGSEQVVAVPLAEQITDTILNWVDPPLIGELKIDGNVPGLMSDFGIFLKLDSDSSDKDSLANIFCLAECKSTDTTRKSVEKLVPEIIKQMEGRFLEKGFPAHLPKDAALPCFILASTHIQFGYLRLEGSQVKFYPCGECFDVTDPCKKGRVAYYVYRLKLGVEHLLETTGNVLGPLPPNPSGGSAAFPVFAPKKKIVDKTPRLLPTRYNGMGKKTQRHWGRRMEGAGRKSK